MMDEPPQALAVGQRTRVQKLSAEAMSRLEQGNPMTAQRRHTSDLQPPRPATDDGNTSWRSGRLARAKGRQTLPTGCWIHRAMQMRRERATILVQANART